MPVVSHCVSYQNLRVLEGFARGLLLGFNKAYQACVGSWAPANMAPLICILFLCVDAGVVYAFTCTHECRGGWRSRPGCFTLPLSTLSFETESLTELGAHQFSSAGWPAHFRDSHISAFPGPGQIQAVTPGCSLWVLWNWVQAMFTEQTL